ncbi:DUF6879 family protein [Halostreptopolyspora alba]|uniref:DUF6879 domain-containing protein n=1 Tax=Halostreptopolyspora alba TaxID=2487137 RepID=A0A3N0EDB4_9ACTN|nr:hypothetical protein EFW17_07675 [Nocardiopsaceae bacterium YIM 96095]
MADLISPGPDLDALFTGYRHTAWRLETRTSYGVAEEDKPYQQWLAGRDPGIEWFRPWLDMVRGETVKGKRMERVRIIDDPPSDYLRWELWGTPYNLAVGEDIRYLPRDHPVVAELPGHDFWLFDSATVAHLAFDGDRFLGVTLDTDPATVVEHAQARDAAWHHALTYTEYMGTRIR